MSWTDIAIPLAFLLVLGGMVLLYVVLVFMQRDARDARDASLVAAFDGLTQTREKSLADIGLAFAQSIDSGLAEIQDSRYRESMQQQAVRAKQLAADHPEWYFPYQYGNDANPRAHYESTGPEILRDVPDITHFVAGLGTAGTLMGVGTYHKEQKPDVQVWAIEPPAPSILSFAEPDQASTWTSSATARSPLPRTLTSWPLRTAPLATRSATVTVPPEG